MLQLPARRLPVVLWVLWVLGVLCAALSSACTNTDTEAGAPDAAAAACAFDDTVAFDPHDGAVLQASNERACVVLTREPLEAAARRGTEWRAVSLDIVVDGVAHGFEGGALAYTNSHHNCQDVVAAPEQGLSVTVDGVHDDPNVCFSGAAEAWRVVLATGSADATSPSGNEVLRPHIPR